MSRAHVVVEIEQGELKGEALTSPNDVLYYSFKGIPYAKPPVGELRFSVPQPPENWEGIRDATKECNICAQMDKETNIVVGDEDCLFLNVFTPKLPTCQSEPLPVMVFFHGGGFVFGNGTDVVKHGPDFLIERNVVVVNVNYRVGVLGFLSLDCKEAPGNMGLRDQVQALKWVQKNIDKFGGNPNNVCIFGISAGGASVEYLLLSPLARGLFHKAIAQSGSSLLHWAHNNDVKKLASTIPPLLGKTVANDNELLTYLKTLPLPDLIKGSMLAIANDKFRGGIHFGFVPTVEKPGDWEPFLDKSPYGLLSTGQFAKVPYMAGVCTREGLLVAGIGAHILQKLVTEKKFIDHFPFELDDAEKSSIENKLKKIYLEGQSNYNEEDAFAIDFFTDVDFLGGAHVAAKLIAKNNSPVFFYEFSYDGILNDLKHNLNLKYVGACHGDENGYLERKPYLLGPITATDQAVRDAMTKLWTNFAKYGDPTPSADPLCNSKWKPITGTGTPCYVIDETQTMKQEVYPERTKFYEEIFAKKFGSK